MPLDVDAFCTGSDSIAGRAFGSGIEHHGIKGARHPLGNYLLNIVLVVP